MTSHWHPAFRPDVHVETSAEDDQQEEQQEIEQDQDLDIKQDDGVDVAQPESTSFLQELEQHSEVAPTSTSSEAQGEISRRTSWAQTVTEAPAGQEWPDDWSVRDTEMLDKGMQEEIARRSVVSAEEGAQRSVEDETSNVTERATASAEVQPAIQPLALTEEAGDELVESGVKDAEAGNGEHQADGYDYQGEVSQMDEAVGEAPSAPLLLDEEALPTIEQPEPVRQEGDSILDEFDGAAAPGQPLPKSHTVPGHLDRSFTSNFTDNPPQDTEPEQNEPRQLENPVSEGWPSIGDDKTFGELLGDDTTATATQNIESEDPSRQMQSADDGWGAAGEDDAFSQLQEQPQAQEQQQAQLQADDDGLGISEEASLQAQQHSQPADDAWGTAVDDDAFGELIEKDPSAVSAQQQETTTIGNDNGEKPEEDLAAIWQAALDDDDLLDESNELDPSTIFGDDDDDFLLDDDEILTSTPLPETTSFPGPVQPQRSTTTPYMPAQASSQNSPQVNPYAVPSHQLLGQTGARGGGTPSTGLSDVYGHFQQAQPETSQRPPAVSAQSFAARSKGGYESPYDLPMDVVKQPRQRPRQAQAPGLGAQAAPTPPPRTASMSSQPAADSMPPPTSTSGAVPPKTTPRANSGFFEDLPVVPKPRARPSGSYTPQPQAPSMPPAPPSQQLPPRGPMAPPQRPDAPPQQPQQSVYGGFQQPDRLPLLPEQPTAVPQNLMQPPLVPSQNHRYSPSLPTTTQTQNRFSPAPPSQGPPGAASRYSPAPGALQKRYSVGPATTHGPPGIQQGHPFAPRTSSPLAFHTDKPHPPLPHELQRNAPSLPSSPPMANGNQTSMRMSPDRAASMGYTPHEPRTPASHLTSPPARPKTQSPPTVMKQARYSMSNTERATSTTALPKVHLSHRRQFSQDLPFVEPNDERAHDPLQRWKGQPIFRWDNSGSIVSSFPKQTPFYAAGHGIPSVKCTPGDISIQGATTFMPMDDRNSKFPGPLTSKAKGRKKDVSAWMSGKIEDLERAAEAVRMDFNMDPDLKKRVEEKLVLWKLVKIFVDHDGVLEGSPKIEEEVRAVLLPNLAQMAQVLDSQSPIGTLGVQADPVDRTVVVQIRQALLEGQRERAVWLAEEKKMWGHAMLLASTMGPEMWKQIIQSFVRSQVKTVGSDARSLAALYQVFAGNSEECVDELVPPSARAGFQMVSKSDGVATGNPLEGLDQWRETLGLVAGNRTPNDAQSMLALGKLLSGYGRAEAAHSCFLFARHVAKHSGADDADVSFVILGADHRDGSFANDIDAILLTEIYEWASSLSAVSGTQAYMPHLQSFKLIHAQELAAHGLTSKAQAYCDQVTSAYTSTTRPSQYYHPTFTQSVTDLSALLSQSPHAGAQGLISKKAMSKVSSGAASWFTKFVSGDNGAEGADGQGAAGLGGNDSSPFGRVNGDSPNNLRPSASSTNLSNPMMGGAVGAGMPFTGSIHGISTPSAFQQPTSFIPNTSGPSKYAPGGASLSQAGGSKYAPAGAPGSLGMPAEIYSSKPASRPASRPASTRGSRSYTPAPVSSSTSTTQPLAVPGPGRPAANRAASAYSADSRRGSAQFGSPGGSYQPSPQGSYQPIPMGSYQPLAMQGAEGGARSRPQSRENAQGMYGYQPQTAAPSSEIGRGPYGYQPQGPAAQQQQPAEEEDEDDEEDAFARPPQQAQFYEPHASDDAEGGGYEPPSTSTGGYEPPSTDAGGYEPPSTYTGGYEPPSTGSGSYEPPSTESGGYEPPFAQTGGYEPPSYQPYNPDAEDSPEEELKPKPKKSFMDDDEDDAAELAARAARMQKAAADKAADDAFRKAAEADAAKDNKKHSSNQSLSGGGEKKGWFGGWFKKDPNAPAQQGNGPIRAKLGEENSFYYDEDLKKWVNKKGGAEAATLSAATPPPPRAGGPPGSRAASGTPGPPSSGPPSGPPSRIVSNALPGSGPPSRIGTPADGSAAPPLSAIPGVMNARGGPPSRPGTGMSNASSLDDLLGGPPGPGRKAGGTAKKKKGGRYVDVMAK